MAEDRLVRVAPEFRYENRREGRRPVFGSARINGQSFPLIDWSSSGFCASGYEGGFYVGERCDLELTLNLNDQETFFTCRTFIVRTDAAGQQIAGVFLEMDPRDRLALAEYFEQADS